MSCNNLDKAIEIIDTLERLGSINSGKKMVTAGSALADVTIAQKCVSHGWGGMEFLIGIPGTIGGASDVLD